MACLLLALAAPAGAQDCPCPPPPPPPPNWSISFGGGLARTGGNTDTSSYNIIASAAYDPHRKNVFRGEALYLHASERDAATVDRTLLSTRDEYALGSRAYMFGQLAYQRDKFKQVDYLISPIAGLGLKLADKPKITTNLDAGVGGAFEKLKDKPETSNFALNSVERLEWRPSAATKVFQRAAGLWKTDDFSDAYYHLEVGLATSLAKRLELKFTFSDDYKTKPSQPGLKKSDTSFLVSLLFKM